MPSAIRTLKASKIVKPCALLGIKTQATSLLPKSLSSEKICEASNLVRKSTTQSRFNKPEMNAIENRKTMLVDEPSESVCRQDADKTVVIERDTTKTLTRSETFTREPDEDLDERLLGLTHNVIAHPSNLTQVRENRLVSLTQVSDDLDKTKKQFSITESDIFDTSDCFLDITENRTKHSHENTLENRLSLNNTNYFDVTHDMNNTTVLPDRTIVLSNKVGRVLNSTMLQCNKLLDLTQTISPARQLMNISQELNSTMVQNTTQLLYMSKHEDIDVGTVAVVADKIGVENNNCMEVDHRVDSASVSAEQTETISAADPLNSKARFSFGLDLTEYTLDCSIELCDLSFTSSAAQPSSPSSQLKRQHSFEMDESLGILTPDQMKEFLDSNTTNTNLDLPLQFPGKLSIHQCRIDQTPSPEELPLDPVEVKTDVADINMTSENQNPNQHANYHQEQQLSQTDSYSKTDQMTKSAASKVSNSFITSVTSITSLDTGYQGDGEMSRPASRGGDHSPSNIPRVNPMKPILGREPSFLNNNNQNIPIVRRQDPMTDSDFFTESDADDILNRGDRRAQIIDGQLYGPMLHGANVYINEQPQAEDSCMESSGIFTDVENRGDEDLLRQRNGHDSDMSPDGSTDTIKSTNTEYNKKSSTNTTLLQSETLHNQRHSMSDSTTSTIYSNCEKGGDRQSLISDISVGSIQSNTFDTNDTLQSGKSKKTSPSRKQNKNEANVALKKHELSKRGVVASGKLNSTQPVNSDMENQENKSPSKSSAVLASSTRKTTTNKWDAVMNKIAVNKTVVKSKNYSDVKSKVTCGLSRRNSPRLLKSPPTTDQLLISTKRTLQNSSKRNRTHSKDSQQSSQSDLSLSSGSPKLRPNSALTARPSKKRDVRTISISPSDLGPPTKSNGNAKPVNIKPTTQQKRPLPNSGVQTTTVPIELKSSPSAKKIAPRRPAQSVVSKSPLKDHNRLVGSTTPSPKGTLSPKTSLRSAPPYILSQSTATPHHRNGNVHLDRVTPKSQTNANQIGRIVNNGKLSNCLNSNTSATAKSDVADVNLIHANKGLEALGVLIQYLVFHLDAFNGPHLKKTHETTTKSLLETKLILNDVRLVCSSLEKQLIEKDEFYGGRERDLQELHRSELNKVEACLAELERSAKDRISTLEKELVNNEQQGKIVTAELEAQLKIAKNKEIELLKRISALSSTENELREKVHASENEFGERLRAAAARERDLNEKINQLKKEAENKERLLEEKLHLTQDEIVVLRNSKHTTELQLSPKSSANRPLMLQEEIESLRCVLELKQSEISDLRRQNHELHTAAESLPNALIKISGLESRLEDLQIQLKAKTEDEKILVNKNKCLEESYSHTLKNRNRLSLHNEELQWKLKQNSEKFSLALSELSKSYQDHSDYLNNTKASLYGQENSNSQSETSSDSMYKSNRSDKMIECFQMDDISPPTSPVIKGVVEKSDSVSWVLEINDEESAEALASRMVKRAGSFRSSFNEKHHHSPITKRQLSHGSALSQSASATSILRHHSDSMSMSQSQHSNTRFRSKSVSIKPSEPKKTMQSQKLEVPALWNEPLCSSSPNIKRSRNTTVKDTCAELLLSEESETESTPKSRSRSNSATCEGTYTQFRRNNAFKQNKRGLITCNTASLTTHRPELCPTLPSHPSVQELKKCQQIKESAGEAMVSGTNSEDEASTGSSDDSISVTSSRSCSSHSGRCRSSIEDALMHKIVASLGGTPMEVSWSEDGDGLYPNESIV